MSAWALLPVMKFFCLIARRDWFINLCDCILRAGERALDHYWPCGTRVFPPTRRFATSQEKCLREGYGTSNEPRPTCLASSICLFVCFFSSQPHAYFIMSEETPVEKCWYWRPTRKLLPINQPIRGRTKLKSRLDYPCFQVSNRGDYFQFT